MHGILWVHPVRIPEGYASERKRDGVALLYPPPTLFSVVLHLRLAAVGRPGSSVRILVQYEGVGTLGSRNSQPRHDLALAHARTHQRNPLLTVLSLSFSLSLFLFSSDSTRSVSDAYMQLLVSIRLSEKFLSFYKEIIDAQCFLFYISLLNYART